MSDLERFVEVRPKLLAIAYRVLGSAADAEDVVQDAFIRWQQRPRDDVASAERFLAKTVTRLALDRLGLARATREVYPGPWLPEPVSDDWPGIGHDVESISMAFLVLLETLSPLERVVFVLHDVFSYSHREIASFIDRDEAACRQLLKRAKDHLRERRPRFDVSPDEHTRLLNAFIEACSSGDLESLRQLLAAPVTFLSDGGGRVPAALNPLSGREVVAKLLLGNMRVKQGLTIHVESINGRPTIVARREDGQVEDVVDIVSERGQIVAIYAIRNPDKLQRLVS